MRAWIVKVDNKPVLITADYDMLERAIKDIEEFELIVLDNVRNIEWHIEGWSTKNDTVEVQQLF